MKKLFEGWFNTTLQGVAFVEAVRNNQGDILDFRYRLVNDAFARILRLTKDALTGQLVRKVFHPEQENDFFLPAVTVLNTGEAKSLLKRYELAGETVWLSVTLTRLDDQLIVNIEDVSESQRSEQQLQRRLAMESIISTISSQFISLPNADEVNTSIVKSLQQISAHIGAERASVFKYSKDYQTGSCLYEWCAPGIESRMAKVSTRPRDCFDWTRPRLENGQIIRLQVDQLLEEDVQEKAFFNFLSVYSMIAVPLMQDGKMQGFLGFYTIQRAQDWDQHDVSLLETFATLIANVLQRQTQENALQRANQRLASLRAIDQALLSYRLAEQPPLVIAMKYMHFMVPCNRIIVFQFDKTTGMAVAQCRVNDGELTMNPDLVVPARYIYKPYEAGKQLSYYPDLQPDTLGVTPELRVYEQGFRSMIIIHLYNGTECIGALALASLQPFFFTEEQQQIAQELASPLAIMLYQQQLDQQLKAYTEQLEQRVEERTRDIRQLSTLHQAILQNAGQAILSTNIEGVIQTANQACEFLLGYNVQELIGKAVRIELESPGSHARFVFYESSDIAGYSTAFFDLMSGSQGYLNVECAAINKQGQPVPILLAASSLVDEEGNITGYVGIATDISTLKHVEAQLKQKNHELKAVFDGAIDLHCIVDLKGNFLTINRAWGMTMGYSAEEVLLMTFWDLTHPDEVEALSQLFRVVVNNQPLRNQINRFRKKEGTYCVLEWNAVKIDQLIYASSRDITERQQAEKQLRNLNQRLQLATQAAGQGIWENNLEENRLNWDDRVWEIYGLKPRTSGLAFSEFLELIYPEDLPSFLERYELELSGDSIFNVTRFVRPDGTVRSIKTIGQIIRNSTGRPIRQIGVIWDVTEQIQAEKALKESEQRFREIADNVDEVFWIHSAEPFQLIYINQASERVWNTTYAQLLQNPYSFMDSVVEEDHPMIWDFLAQYKAGQECEVCYRIITPDGSFRWLSVRSFMIRDETGKVIRHIGIGNDVTSQKEKEIVLQKALHREQELNVLKSQFVSTASHEFRTPLATIQSSVDLIKLYIDLPAAKSTVSIQKHLAVIEKEIDQFSSLLTDILTIGTIESGKISFNPAWVDIVAICEEIIATHFKQRADQRTVQLLLEGMPCPVYLDKKLISHVLVNLLSNAFKFSSLDPCLRILFEDDHLILQVIDKGIGIPAREMATLFEAFFRASNTGAIAGTGLGLLIARQFVELHGGQLSLTSEEKKGTTCRVTLPLAGAITASTAAPIGFGQMQTATQPLLSTSDPITLKNDTKVTWTLNS